MGGTFEGAYHLGSNPTPIKRSFLGDNAIAIHIAPALRIGINGSAIESKMVQERLEGDGRLDILPSDLGEATIAHHPIKIAAAPFPLTAGLVGCGLQIGQVHIFWGNIVSGRMASF